MSIKVTVDTMLGRQFGAIADAVTEAVADSRPGPSENEYAKVLCDQFASWSVTVNKVSRTTPEVWVARVLDEGMAATQGPFSKRLEQTKHNVRILQALYGVEAKES